MLAYYFPRFVAFYRNLRLVGLLAALCAALGLQQSCERQPTRDGINSVLPGAQAKGLPVATVYLTPRRRCLSYDTSTAHHSRPDLQRKMLPQSRWPAAGAYLVGPRPRRPRQGALDSAAAAARRLRP